eukprot:Plantae.Rhodophyta-Palmaria_palmata.ctg322.p2 GENE.Plantae.Rhodophyta-Palmaria_palmata.ctg322~~Plantae.Rhodophyta-Palmaria_palmata.ctg322.p2  ORF type:complete len:104 (-),score=3.36 Plantae.Rhodophyta-Palmaria_palmata.ctg322:595-906(-)
MYLGVECPLEVRLLCAGVYVSLLCVSISWSSLVSILLCLCIWLCFFFEVVIVTACCGLLIFRSLVEDEVSDAHGRHFFWFGQPYLVLFGAYSSSVAGLAICAA